MARRDEARDTALVGVCGGPKPIDRGRLERALRFEFDLPINGEPLARAARAHDVFFPWLARRTQ